MLLDESYAVSDLFRTRVRACVWDGGLFGIGPGYGAPDLHAHHAHQLTISVAGEALRFRCAPDSAWVRYSAVLVGADRPHAFDGSGAIVAMIFVDPQTHEGRWLTRSATGDITVLSDARLRHALPELLRLLSEPFDGASAARLVEAVVRAACTGPRPARPQDARIRAALEYLRTVEGGRAPLEEVARVTYLSPGRFAHLFREHVGIPFQRFILWRRLNRAVLLVSEGRSLTAAAMDAGFADAAHLTRTFRQMFGLAPSAMAGPVDFYEMPTPFASADPIP